MDATHAACDGLWMRDPLAKASPFVPHAALLLGLAYMVLDPMPPRRVVLATGPARSYAAEFGTSISSFAPSGPCRPAARARPKASMSPPVERRAQATAMRT